MHQPQLQQQPEQADLHTQADFNPHQQQQMQALYKNEGADHELGAHTPDNLHAVEFESGAEEQFGELDQVEEGGAEFNQIGGNSIQEDFEPHDGQF